MTVTNNLPKKLRLWRGDRTQLQAARALDVPLRTYQSWEEAVRCPSPLAMRWLDPIIAPDEKTPARVCPQSAPVAGAA